MPFLYNMYSLILLYFFLYVSGSNKVKPQFMPSNAFINLCKKKIEKSSNV